MQRQTGPLEAGTNMVVSGVCGEFYYAMLPDGTYFYIPQSAVAQVPEATPGADTRTYARTQQRRTRRKLKMFRELKLKMQNMLDF